MADLDVGERDAPAREDGVVDVLQVDRRDVDVGLLDLLRGEPHLAGRGVGELRVLGSRGLMVAGREADEAGSDQQQGERVSHRRSSVPTADSSCATAVQ